jgi:hypothetical protein
MTRCNDYKIIVAGTVCAFFVAFGGSRASACNRIDGCARDVMIENERMMRSGENDAAMRTGSENVRAYQEMMRANERAKDRPVKK